MGNAESRALTQTSPLMKDELLKAHRNFLTFKKDYSLDRCAFSLLFDATIIPFTMIDQLFDSYDIDKSGAIDFTELALGLVASSSLQIDEKLNIIFDSMDANGDEELSMDEVFNALSRFLRSAVVRMRGTPNEDGKVRFYDRRCSGCKEAPVNLSYECIECRRGTALGVPITVHLCKDCVSSWEGYGGNAHDFKHTLKHKMVKSVSAPNPHQVTHVGVECSCCGTMPIIGRRIRCKDCMDFVSLCDECFTAGEEPRGHLMSHNIEVMEKGSSLESEVERFIHDIFAANDTHGDGRIARAQFIAWGNTSEAALALLKGLEVQHIKLGQFEQRCECKEFTTHSILGSNGAS